MEDLTKLFESLREVRYKGNPKTGIHVNWNAPKGKEQPAWEILLSILSACYWTSHNGPIDLYTDEIGLKKVEELGLRGLYRNVKMLDPAFASQIDPVNFWAASKFIAMLECDEPAYFLDQDLLILKNLTPDPNTDVTYAHRERITGMFYPIRLRDDVNAFYGNQEDGWAYNCSLIHFENVDTMRSYAANSLRYIGKAKGAVIAYPPSAIMCTIEQYGLAQFCAQKGLVAEPLIEAIYNPFLEDSKWESPPNGRNDINEVGGWMYHSWAEKAHLRENWTASLEFATNIVSILEGELKISLEPLLQKLNFREH